MKCNFPEASTGYNTAIRNKGRINLILVATLSLLPGVAVTLTSIPVCAREYISLGMKTASSRSSSELIRN